MREADRVKVYHVLAVGHATAISNHTSSSSSSRASDRSQGSAVRPAIRDETLRLPHRLAIAEDPPVGS